MRRFYIHPHQIGEKESVITGSDVHHLRDVLRLQPRQPVIVFDGTGREYQAEIVSIGRREIRVAIQGRVQTKTEHIMDLTIAQGYLKDKKMDAMVRQLTELGVGQWIPFLSRRSVPVPDEKRLQGRYRRWQKISLEALKQCGRSRFMEIAQVATYDEMLKQARGYDLKIVFWEDSKSTRLIDQVGRHRPKSVFVVVGPEGGFGPEEISIAGKEGFKTVGLGPRTLKAETATLAAAVVIQHLFGDIR